MTTTACAEDWREIADKANREAREWRENFATLQRALVGDTGASGIEVAHALRKDAERYRRLRESGSALKLYVYEDKADPFSGDWHYKPGPEDVDAFADGLGAA